MGANPGFLTIRGGKLRGKKIAIPGDGVRPTTDKMREQIFNLVDRHFRLPDGRARLPGARVLDAFAGTGALGLEALSRGAGDVFAWDSSPREAKALQSLGLNASHQSALAPKTASAAMDLIFLDPPYAKGLINQALTALAREGWIDQDTLIIAEAEASLSPPEGFDIKTEKAAGQSKLWLLSPSPK